MQGLTSLLFSIYLPISIDLYHHLHDIDRLFVGEWTSIIHSFETIVFPTLSILHSTEYHHLLIDNCRNLYLALSRIEPNRSTFPRNEWLCLHQSPIRLVCQRSVDIHVRTVLFLRNNCIDEFLSIQSTIVFIWWNTSSCSERIDLVLADVLRGILCISLLVLFSLQFAFTIVFEFIGNSEDVIRNDIDEIWCEWTDRCSCVSWSVLL